MRTIQEITGIALGITVGCGYALFTPKPSYMTKPGGGANCHICRSILTVNEVEPPRCRRLQHLSTR